MGRVLSDQTLGEWLRFIEERLGEVARQAYYQGTVEAKGYKATSDMKENIASAVEGISRKIGIRYESNTGIRVPQLQEDVSGEQRTLDSTEEERHPNGAEVPPV